MGRFLIFFIAIVSLYSNNIINTSYFPSKQKVDVLFSLDLPFKGKIVKISDKEYKIEGVITNKIEQKKFQNGLNILISPFDNNSIDFKVIYNKPVSIKASITAKGYGLRLRIEGIEFEKQQDILTKKVNNMNNDVMEFDYVNYIIVILILIMLILILFVVKKQALKKLPQKFQEDGFKIIYQRMIDPKNKIALIELFEVRYLILLSDNGNLLLNKFSQDNQEILNDISSQKGFDNLLEEEVKNQREFIKKASEIKDMNEL